MTTPLLFRQFYKFDGVNLPQRFPVRVIWNGRGPFEAARVTHPQTRAACWVTYEKVNKTTYAVFLPCGKKPRDPLQPWKAWRTLRSEQPDFWAPIDPDKFKLFPLPPVALTLPDEDEPPRMWSSRQSYSAADAAADAAEMEADRDQARNGPKRANGQKRSLWWLDISRIRYAPAGYVTRADAEGRIMRALAQEDMFVRASFGLGLDRRDSGLSDQQLRDLAEWEAKRAPSIRPRFEAVQPDLDDYGVAMSWFTALGARHLLPGEAAKSGGWRIGKSTEFTTAQWVLYFASRDDALSMRQIAQLTRIVQGRKISAVRVSQVLKLALEGVWIIANEFKDAGSTNRAIALEQIQAGNRRARGAR
ncbi:hypothetical protein [Hyphomicrobium sp. ghe19]|uniref:hypothetical protein n=1 Tax=Hyphomicrobium sp. ghe19 TaxID=2682968 RepID=UPI0013673FB9|nr:hypothetical protein HYPP_03815 [Hyphomicrobium sp. ghe19]